MQFKCKGAKVVWHKVESISNRAKVAKRITIVLDMQGMLLFHFGTGKTTSSTVHTSFSMQRKCLELENCTKLCAIFFSPVFILFGTWTFYFSCRTLWVLSTYLRCKSFAICYWSALMTSYSAASWVMRLMKLFKVLDRRSKEKTRAAGRRQLRALRPILWNYLSSTAFMPLLSCSMVSGLAPVGIWATSATGSVWLHPGLVGTCTEADSQSLASGIWLYSGAHLLASVEGKKR